MNTVFKFSWKSFRRRLLLSLALTPAVIYLIACLYMYFNQESMIFYPTVLPADFQFQCGAAYEEISIPAEEGAVLNALYFHAAESKGVVLYFHGQGEDVQDYCKPAVRDFVGRGYDLVMPDYRGYGKSTGTIASEAIFLNDAEAVYQYVQERYPEEKIVLYGYSLGTGVATYLASLHQPRALVLEGAYYSGLSLCDYRYPVMPCGVVLRYPLRSDRWIKKTTCPVYFFHGTKDVVIPYQFGARLRREIVEHSELLTIEGGSHWNLPSSSIYQETLDRILGVKF